MIEIQGEPASGKTHLLYYLAGTCLLPSELNSVSLGGWDKAVVVFDTDGTFDPKRLLDLLISRLKRALPEDAELDLEITRQKLAKKIHIFRPSSTIQLATTLSNLPAYHEKHLPNDEIGLLIIDSVSTFYWQDRFASEQFRTPVSHPAQSSNALANHPLQHVLSLLQRFRISHGPVILLSNWGLFGNRSVGLSSPGIPASTAVEPTVFFRQHLQPFPNPFAAERLNESRTGSITNPHGANSEGSESVDTGSRLFPLTHHLTLVRSSKRRSTQTASASVGGPEEPVSDNVWRVDLDQTDDIVDIVGYVRTPGYARVGRFAFMISREGMVLGGEGQ